MENRSHGESREKRVERFQNGPPTEIILTLLNSIDNYFNNEIRLTTEGKNYQTSLLFLGIHAVALTISEGFFGKSGISGYKFFLEKFVDGNTPDTKFSDIAELIHDWRNVLAHQWLGSIGHSVAYDYGMKEGYKLEGELTLINPKVYLDHYLKAFGPGGKVWDYRVYLKDYDLEEIRERLLKKFLER